MKEDSPVISCIGLGKKPERKAGNELNMQQQQQQQQLGKDCSTVDMDMGALWGPRLHHQHQWNSMEISPLPWQSSYHTCHRVQRADPHLYNFDFTLPRGTDWGRYESLFLELDRGRGYGVCKPTPQCVIHSVAHLEMTDNMRSSSFGKFDTFKHQAQQAKPDENGSTAVPSAEVSETSDKEQAKHGTIGKKMRAISMTMCKRIGKKYIKALSEEVGEDTEGDHETVGDADTSAALAKACKRSSNSLESLYSLHSGQSSSSGVTSGSEGSSNRDSLRLEEEVPHTGNFCGRARVHTDFVPSPYDTESLRLKVGDVIDVISKPPMGIWTGMLNNRVGIFKFIYVDMLEPEKEPEPQRRVFPEGRCKRPRPNTLLELLACLNLEEHASSLMLNGYQTVEDLKELKEQHLIELNMEPEHRQRLLAATECLHEPDPNAPNMDEADKEPKSPEVLTPELKDCPRDSGCYIPSDVSESSKDDTVNLVALNTTPAEA